MFFIASPAPFALLQVPNLKFDEFINAKNYYFLHFTFHAAFPLKLPN